MPKTATSKTKTATTTKPKKVNKTTPVKKQSNKSKTSPNTLTIVEDQTSFAAVKIADTLDLEAAKNSENIVDVDLILATEEIIKAEQQVTQILDNLNEEEKKEVLLDLVTKFENDQKIHKEKVAEEVLPEVKSKNVVNSSLFDKIYTEDFVAQNQPRGFFASIWDVLTSQTVWRFVALGLLLGVGLFYIQGLQPSILRSYAVSTNNQVQKVDTRYNEQIKDFATTQASLVAKFDYSPDLFCSQIDPYNQASKDVESINRLKFNLFPDKSLKTLPTPLQASLPEIEARYNDFYAYYTKQITTYSNSTSKLQDIVNFLNYKNVWLQTCTLVEKTPTDLTGLQKQCQVLIQASNEFVIQKPAFFSDISEYHDKGLALCNGLTNATLKNFIRDFSTNFGLLASYTPDFKALNTELTTINNEFLNQKNQATKEILNIENSKKPLAKQFYLLNYKF